MYACALATGIYSVEPRDTAKHYRAQDGPPFPTTMAKNYLAQNLKCQIEKPYLDLTTDLWEIQGTEEQVK